MTTADASHLCANTQVRVQYTHVYIVHTEPTGIHSSTHSTDLNSSICLAREGRGREEVANLVAFWRGDLLTAAVTFVFFFFRLSTPWVTFLFFGLPVPILVARMKSVIEKLIIVRMHTHIYLWMNPAQVAHELQISGAFSY